MLCWWDDLPHSMKNEAVRPYYNSLQQKKISLFCKMIFDRSLSLIMLMVLSPVFLILAVLIKFDSPGEVFFRQERVTQYGKKFRIHKFRTMVKNAESFGTQVTVKSDMRITKIGKKLRGCRLDELPQLIDIWQGNMSFVGTRPEVPRYVEAYTDEMMATLLLPAGVTSDASIRFKDEENLLSEAGNIDEAYIKKVLPQKMAINLQSLKNFSIYNDIKIMLATVKAVI